MVVYNKFNNKTFVTGDIMENKRRIEKTIESGIYKKYLVEYFLSISDSYDGQGKFTGTDWEVEIGEE